jgi:ribosome-associated translation inhibitor RaiA
MAMQKRDREALRQICTDSAKTLTAWLDVEHMVVALGGFEAGHVAVSREGGPYEQTRVAVEVWGGGHSFDATEADGKPMKAADQARRKLESQIRRERGRNLRSRDQHR